MRRQPMFAAAVVVTPTVAIAANAAIFSFVIALLIRPFQFRDPDQLVQIRSERGGKPGMLSMREVMKFEKLAPELESLAINAS